MPFRFKFLKTGCFFLIILASSLFCQVNIKKDSGGKRNTDPHFLNASFYQNPSVPSFGKKIEFIDISTGNPESWLWSFGDGSTSTERTPLHIYESPNLYFVTLKIKRGKLTSVVNKSILVRSTNYDSGKPKANFVFEPQNPQAGVPINFFDRSGSNPAHWIWGFGYFGFSLLKDPVKIFYSESVYTVTLTVKNQFGSDKITKDIEVGPPPPNVKIAKTCALTDVQAAIATAKIGDIVLVPEGKAVWGAKLIIRKGITLKGVGVDKTIIVNGYDGQGDYDACLIMYRPDDFEANSAFRVTGFTFDINNKSHGIMLAHHKDSSLTPQTKIRIDHNKFINAMAIGPSHQAIINNGMRGVVDNNIFEDCIYPIRNQWCYGDGHLWWDNWEKWGLLVYGTADNNMYYEDNVFSNCTIVMDSQFANRYVFRYNTVYHKAESYVATLDSHGNQGGQMYSSFGGEVYGNLIFLSYKGESGVRILDHRGGKYLCFMNTVIPASDNYYAYINVRDEYPDSDNPTINPSPQFPNDSYYFLNKYNYNGSYCAVEEDEHVDNPPFYSCPAKDRDYYVGTDSFNGTSGVGYGPLSARPTPQKVGVGYWATDQNIANLKDMVGKNPLTPISGTLFKCTSPGIWTAYYQPYTYPHPLRNLLND